MTPGPDLFFSLALLGFAGFLGIAYGVRWSVLGRARFDRTDQEGGSALVSKGLMEMAYWSLQPAGRLLILLGFTPNAISFLSLAFGAAAGISLAFGRFGIGGALSMLSALMDALDGMVARSLRISSESGEVLDSVVDRYAEFFFLAGLMEHFRQSREVFALCALALLGSFMVSYSTAKAEALRVKPPRGMMRRTERAVYLTLGAVLTPVIQWLGSTRTPVPMIAALVLVGVVSNYSALKRLRAVAGLVRAR